MSGIHPFFYRMYPRNIRQDIHRLHREKQDRVIQKNEIQKPKTVVLVTGQRVKYEGP